MTQRERNLAIAVATLLLGWGGWYLWDWRTEAMQKRISVKNSAELALSNARLDEAKAKASLARLEAWQQRSLPRDRQVAQSQYRAWLVEQFEVASLDFEKIRLVNSRNRGQAYTTLTYTSDAAGELAGVTKFLHAFYDTPVAHKLTQLKLVPIEPKGQLRMTITVEALIVNGTIRESGLPEAPAGRLERESVDAYLASIKARDLFSEYVPPPPPKPPRAEVKQVAEKSPPKPKFDDAEHAYLTGIVQAGDRLQAWITVRTTGKVLRLFAGDAIKVGLLDGKVASVNSRQIVVETADASVAIPLGKHLREGNAVSL